MRKCRVIASCFVCLFSLLGITRLSYADSAEVLPKGVFRVSAETRFFLPIRERFNPDGNAEPLAVDFNADLNSSVFPQLKTLESFFRLPSGSANLGRTIVSFEYQIIEERISVQYGITDRLTAGILIPYFWEKNKVKARLDTTNATVGKSPSLDALVPLGTTRDTVPLTTEDIQQILGKGLDVRGNGTIEVPGFKFKRFETWSGEGLADIQAGLKYQYLRTKNWRLAFTGGVSFPTGRIDDPDNLTDLGFGTGAYGLLFYFNNDYTGIKNLVLNSTFKYTLWLPDSKTRRVSDDVNQPITANKVKVDRDIGDTFEFEASGTYNFDFLKGLSASGLYRFGFALRDHVSGPGNFNFKSLEDETAWTQHVFIVGTSYSTLPLYIEKKFPFPLTVSVSYRNRFAGTNNVNKSQYISLELSGFF